MTSTDHVHIRTVSIDFEPLLEPGLGRKALDALLEDHSERGMQAFQAAMQGMTGLTAEKRKQDETEARLPVARPHLTVVDGVDVVQQGNRSRADAMGSQERIRTAGDFARQALQAARCTDELALLDYSTELHGAEASVFGLFGVDVVTGASVAVIGDGNTVRTGLQFERGKSVLGDGLGGLDRIRKEAIRMQTLNQVEPPDITEVARQPRTTLDILLGLGAHGDRDMESHQVRRPREILESVEAPELSVHPLDSHTAADVHHGLDTLG